VKGTIVSTGALTVGEHARIKADITTGSIVIHGHVEGNVVASDRCALESGGVLRGDIESPRLAMHDESTFFGRAKISHKKS
jgi:cytoskeletal protein CcmA (bactofilin family)